MQSVIALRYLIASLILALGFTQFSLGKEGIAVKPIHIGMLVGGGRGEGRAYFFGKSMAKSGGLWRPFVGVFTNVSWV